MILYHQTQFGSKRISSSADTKEVLYFNKMSPCRNLDPENSKPIFLRALSLMMLHHNTKFDNKIFDGLEDIWANTDVLTLHCKLDL